MINMKSITALMAIVSINVVAANIDGYVRIHHIVDGNENNFDPNTGSTLGFGLKYGNKLSENVSAGVSYYGVTDTGLTEDQDVTNSHKLAYGQFMNTHKNDAKYGDAIGAHLTYNLNNGSKFTIARDQFNSPLTKIQITHVPNMYQYLRYDLPVEKGSLSFAYIDKMAYGSRSVTDYSLIGETTGTAGMMLSPLVASTSTQDPAIIRGDYYDIEDTVTGVTNSSGIAVVGYNGKVNGQNVKVWDFKAIDILNNIYFEIDYKLSSLSTKISAQVLHQSIDESSLKATYGGTMYGVKSNTKVNNIMLELAYNSKDNGGILNPWGMNPGYTSSIFSRNEYRADVDAYKVSVSYKLDSKSKFMVSHADYGQSSMSGAVREADETDMVFVYKPMKNVMVKLFNANRQSEKADSKTQNHTRIVANYSF